jgi:hypothetical protein
MGDHRRASSIEPGVAERSIAGYTQPLSDWVQGAWGTFRLIVVGKIAVNDSAEHFLGVADNFNSVIRFLDVDLSKRAEVARVEVSAKGLIGSFGAFAL